MCEQLKKGETHGIIGVKNESEAQKTADRLLKFHGVKTTFEPMYASQPPKPVFASSAGEEYIARFEYPPKKLTGYLFKINEN